MRRRVLIVDPSKARRSETAALLQSGYHRVAFANDAATALAMTQADERPSIVIAADAPDCDAIALCAALRARPETASLPFLVRLDDARCAADPLGSRLRALEAGADDVLSPPFARKPLLARLRSLNRMQNMSEELELREATARRLGVFVGDGAAIEPPAPARVTILAHEPAFGRRMARDLRTTLGVVSTVVFDGFTAIAALPLQEPDALIVADDGGFSRAGEDAIDFIQVASTIPEMRHTPIIFATTRAGGGDARLAEALDAGATDGGGADEKSAEIALRLRAQLRRKRYSDLLRAHVNESLRDAALDPLTGLYNRRYFDHHAARLHEKSRASRAALSAVMFDLDEFKGINDRFGHAAGDAALRTFAQRLQTELRGEDFACRYGGDEFLVLLPGARASEATEAANRVRSAFSFSPPAALAVRDAPLATVSAGVADLECAGPLLSGLLDAADSALRAAKSNGRNRVSIAA